MLYFSALISLGFKLHAEEKSTESASDFSRRAREKVRECKFSQGSNRRRAEVECSPRP